MKNVSSDAGLITADLFRILSRGFSYPSDETVEDIKGISGELISEGSADKTITLHLEAILSDLDIDQIRDEYSRLFFKKLVSLNESFCINRLDIITDVAGFYKAFGLTPKSGDAPDSLSYELEFMAMLRVKLLIAQTDEQKLITGQAYQKFMCEHLEPFVNKLIEKIEPYKPISFYRHLLNLLTTIIQEEKKSF